MLLETTVLATLSFSPLWNIYVVCHFVFKTRVWSIRTTKAFCLFTFIDIAGLNLNISRQIRHTKLTHFTYYLLSKSLTIFDCSKYHIYLRRSSSWLIAFAVCCEHMLVVTDIEFLRKGKTQNRLKVHYIDVVKIYSKKYDYAVSHQTNQFQTHGWKFNIQVMKLKLSNQTTDSHKILLFSSTSTL